MCHRERQGRYVFSAPPLHRHCHARRARPTRKSRGRSNDQKILSKIVIAAEVGKGSNIGDASASSAGMKHANSGDEGEPPAIPIPKRRRTAEKSVPRAAVGKGKKAAAAPADDDVNSLFWLVEVRRATSHRPPACRSARNWIRRVQRVFFFSPTSRCHGCMRCGADQGRAPRRARAWRDRNDVERLGCPDKNPDGSSLANPRSSRRRRAPRGTPPHPSLFLTSAPVVRQLCEGGARRRGAPRVRARPISRREPRGRRAISSIAPETIAAPDPAFVADRIPRSRPRADPRGSPPRIHDLASSNAPTRWSHVQLSGYFSPPRRLHPLTPCLPPLRFFARRRRRRKT